MKAWLAALPATLRAFSAALLVVIVAIARAFARHAKPSLRVTAEGARAIGAKAGAAAKSAVFALPGKVLHTLRGKVVEIAITIALTAGAAYYLSDPRVIRSEPLACWFSDTIGAMSGARAPLKPGEGFRVLVAQLDGDEEGRFTGNVALSFNDVKGVEVRELCRSLGVPAGEAAAQGWERAKQSARELLDDWHAQVIVWGKAAASAKARLYITTPTGSSDFNLYELDEGLLLPAQFSVDFARQMQAVVLSGVKLDPNLRLSPEQVKLLIERLPQLRTLALARTKALEANLTAVGVYVISVEQLVIEDGITGARRVDPQELLPVVDRLSDGIDPVKHSKIWAGATALEALALLVAHGTSGNLDGMRLAAERFERLLNSAKPDPDMVTVGLSGAGMAWYGIAELTGDPADMRRAIDFLGQARSHPAMRGRNDSLANADLTFARAVEWLSRNAGDLSLAPDAIHGLDAMLRAFGSDEASGRSSQAMLLRAQLQTRLAAYRMDLAQLRSANASLDRLLTKRLYTMWPATYVKGAEERVNARTALARATGVDADFERALQSAEEALRFWPRAKDLSGHAEMVTRHAAVLKAWGAAARDAGRVRAAISEINGALAGVESKKAPHEWAQLKIALAQATCVLGEVESHDAAFDETLTILRDVRTTMRRLNQRWDAAGASAELVTTLQSVGFRRDSAAPFLEITEILRGELAEDPTSSKDLALWAYTYFDLGSALMSAGSLSRDASLLAQSVEALRAALAGRPREKNEELWLMTAMQLSTALAMRGEIANDEGNLQEAIALAGQTRVSASAGKSQAATAARIEAWAQTALALVTRDVAPAEKAREAMKAALAEMNGRADAPSDNAWTKLQYGRASIAIGLLKNDAAMLAEGLSAVGDAKAFGTQNRIPGLVRSSDAALAKAPKAHASDAR